MRAPPRAVCYQMYFAASAITTTVKITNAAICTQKLLVRPCLFAIWVFISITSPCSIAARNTVIQEKRRDSG